MSALPAFTDIGLNLASPQFAKDHHEVLARARAAGVRRFVLTGTSLASTAACAKLAEGVPEGDCYFTAGVHPHNASTLDAAGAAQLQKFLSHPRAVAGGEAGLDYFRDLSPRAVQRHAFATQVNLAIQAGKPLFLHERHAHADFLGVLDEFGTKLPRCVVHCFTGNAEQARAYVKRGYFIGITGWVGQRRRNADLVAALPEIPLERILLETDAPYLTPDGMATPQPRRNEPALLPGIAAILAQSVNVPLAELAAIVEKNTELFFGPR